MNRVGFIFSRSLDRDATLLAKERIKRGWTQKEAARRLGCCSRSRLANIEGGQMMPSLGVALRLANLYDGTVEDFWTWP